MNKTVFPSLSPVRKTIADLVRAITAVTILRTAAVAILVFLSVLTFRRAQAFSSEEALMRDTLLKNPTAWGAHNDLGCILARRNSLSEAVAHFEASLRSKPDNYDAHINLGQAFEVMGRLEEAQSHELAAVNLKPHSANAHHCLANVLVKRGNSGEALRHLRLAVSLQPENQTRMELAGLLYKGGDPAQAIAQLRAATRVAPVLPEALNNLAWLLATSEDDGLRNGNEAVRCARRACRMTGYKEPSMVGTLAAAYAEAGRFKQAVETAEQAVRLAESRGLTQFAAVNRQLLAQYRDGHAWHEKPSPSISL